MHYFLCVLYDIEDYRYNKPKIKEELLNMTFIEKKYDVFQMFNDCRALVIAGSIEDYNTMTSGEIEDVIKR